jgi:selenide,water dikinase
LTWEGGPALVQTVDFFTPIVDDPYIYGQIAAANAVSDIYAMGGRPVTALAIAAFPEDGLEPATIQAIFRGGFDKLREAGVSLLGGHTVRDREVKFGYAVTGAIDPARVLSNGGARPGDRLFLTKPLGTGIVGTAIKFERAPAGLVEEAIASMRMLNRAAAAAMGRLAPGLVHACTDITGFGLVGHASEMARASGVTLAFDAAAVPIFNGVRELAQANRSGGMLSNRQYFAERVEAGATDEALLDILYDPQTSGGLLVALAEGASDEFAAACSAAGVAATRVGETVSAVPGRDVQIR